MNLVNDKEVFELEEKEKNVLFPINLQLFASNGESGEAADLDDNTSDGKEKTDTSKEGDKDIMIPKSRFDEINNKYKDVQKKLDEILVDKAKAEKERKAREQEEAESKGEFEELYGEAKSNLESIEGKFESASERIEALEEVINGLLESKLESIDEKFHDLIPESMSAEEKLAWVSNAEKKGLFGSTSKEDEPLGEQTNPKDGEEVDTSKMNPLQLMLAGYGRK